MGGPEMASGEAADSRAKVSSLFRFRVFSQSLRWLERGNRGLSKNFHKLEEFVGTQMTKTKGNLGQALVFHSQSRYARQAPGEAAKE